MEIKQKNTLQALLSSRRRSEKHKDHLVYTGGRFRDKWAEVAPTETLEKL